MVQEVRTQEGVMGGDVLIDELELLLDRVQPARRRRRGSGQPIQRAQLGSIRVVCVVCGTWPRAGRLSAYFTLSLSHGQPQDARVQLIALLVPVVLRRRRCCRK